jgi:hypothetical protein
MSTNNNGSSKKTGAVCTKLNYSITSASTILSSCGTEYVDSCCVDSAAVAVF